MSALPKSAEAEAEMTVDEFFAWAEDSEGRWELVDGVPVAMSPPSPTHALIQSELCYLITRALIENEAPCSVFSGAGVIPRVNADRNLRIPDVSVVCGGYETEERALTEPIVVIEILSPGNKRQTWANVWTYTTIPSIKEIVVLQSQSIGAKLLRRQPDGGWPKEPEAIEAGDLALESIGVRFPLAAAYRTTKLSS
ncbi:MAG TPA: Uma2 family endonuclease [Methylocystis sp.]|nr:Uma2 family endonuclease [Methylocystis sp.]